MDISIIKNKALAFNDELLEIKKGLSPKLFSWYPYGSMHNFVHLDKLLTKNNRNILDPKKFRNILDIGAADGDNSFFLEKLGFDVDIIENAPTNYNALQGAKLLKKYFESSVNIFEINLDSQFKFPNKTYDLVFFLGTLYHLKSPFFILEQMSKLSKYCFLSTRITKFAPDKKTNLSDFSLAYLVDETETNNDPTNYWIFTQTGLRRLLKRTGWDIVDYISAGNKKTSDPATLEGDERSFCLIKSKYFLG